MQGNLWGVVGRSKARGSIFLTAFTGCSVLVKARRAVGNRKKVELKQARWIDCGVELVGG